MSYRQYGEATSQFNPVFWPTLQIDCVNAKFSIWNMEFEKISNLKYSISNNNHLSHGLVNPNFFNPFCISGTPINSFHSRPER